MCLVMFNCYYFQSIKGEQERLFPNHNYCSNHNSLSHNNNSRPWNIVSDDWKDAYVYLVCRYSQHFSSRKMPSICRLTETRQIMKELYGFFEPKVEKTLSSAIMLGKEIQ